MAKEVLCHNVLGEEFLVPASKLQFRPSVYGLLIQNGKILLSPQWDGYDFPGGGLKIEEDLEEALRREFWEETGLKVDVGKIIKASTSFYAPRPRSGEESVYWNCVLLHFLVTQTGGELSTANFDEAEKSYLGLATWLDLNKLEGLKFYNHLGSAGSLEIIKQAASQL